MPSLIVDIYDQVFVMQTLSQGAERLKSTLVDLLVEEFKPQAVVERNDGRVREFEGLELRTGVLYERVTEPRKVATGTYHFGARTDEEFINPQSEIRNPKSSGPVASAHCSATSDIQINQDGIRFFVSTLSGQKTGAFLDQRENYLAACSLAHGRALDCFTFNGGFALHIASACDGVLGIDISADAIAAAQRNAELNDARNVEFRAANVFDALREMEAAGEHFDTIVLDPPAFAKNRASVTAAARGYKEINLRALKLLNPGGVLVTCTCSYNMSEDVFLDLAQQDEIDEYLRLGEAEYEVLRQKHIEQLRATKPQLYEKLMAHKERLMR